MAEIILAIFIFVIVATTYAAVRYLYDTSQVLAPWLIAAFIVAIGIAVYIANKANEAGESIQNYYDIDETL